MKNKCKIKNCDKLVLVKIHNLCRSHYSQLIRKGYVLNSPLRKYRKLELILTNPI
jgi:transketolase N-terminal domain/subunit